MELSVMSPALAQMSLEDAVKYLSDLGVDSMELGVGGYPGTAHLDAEECVKNPSKIDEVKEIFKKYFCDGNSAVINSKSLFIFHKLTAVLPS